jgi:transposase
MEHPMQKLNDLSRSLAPLEPDGTLIAVIEMSQSSWLVAGIVPGVERQPLKKLAADEIALLRLLHRWREEAEKAGRGIERTAVAFEAGRDGFWLARWLRTRGIEAHVIHALSVAVSRECERAWFRTASFCGRRNKRRLLKAPNSFGPVRPLVTGRR